jgi:hypothetical protein
MPAPVAVLCVSDSDKQHLLEWASAFGTPQQVALRCRIVLASASGQSDVVTAEQLKTNRHTVRLWRTRFVQQGLEGLWEVAPGRGRKPSYGREKIRAPGSEQVDGEQHLAQPQSQTASDENL